MTLSTPVIVVTIIAILALLVGFIGKIRWLTLISIFLFLVAAWMLIGEYLTGIEF